MQNWQFIKGSTKQADLSYWDDYVISHRPKRFIVSYRPPNKHIHVGEYETLEEAKSAAEEHARTKSI